MDLGIEGKIAMVAAASKGLGKATAMGLAREGAKLSICARGEEALNAAADEMRKETGAEVLTVVADMAKAADCDRFVSETLRVYGGVDILVTNAGGPPSTTFLDSAPEDYLKGVELNLMSTVRLCKGVVPHMKTQGWGRIVNITSVSAKSPLAGLILSNVSRPGVLGLAKSMSNELAQYGILVNSVCPGFTLTDRVQQVTEARAQRAGVSFDDVLKESTRPIPVGRMGRPEEFANVVVFLASERASYVTGVAIQIDGGLYSGLY